MKMVRFLIGWWFCLCFCNLQAQEPFRVMFYNVENLFDCRHDTLKDDKEFLPDGGKKWTPYRYWKKINSLSKVIAAVGETRIPDIIGVCEIENDSVLFDWTRRSAMRSLGYRYVMTTQSPDVRGIDVALLYQPGSFKLLGKREVRIPSVENGFRPTRNLLYVKGKIISGDTLHVVVCHFPSRLGKTRETHLHRKLAASSLNQIIDSVFHTSVNARMIVMGDFNAELKDDVFKDITPHKLKEPKLNKQDSKEIKGSYRYHGIWEQIDHILVSPALLDETHGFYTSDGCLTIVSNPFLCELEKTYGGFRPFRTYQGPIYKGGYSDHFPIVLDFVWFGNHSW